MTVLLLLLACAAVAAAFFLGRALGHNGADATRAAAALEAERRMGEAAQQAARAGAETAALRAERERLFADAATQLAALTAAQEAAAAARAALAGAQSEVRGRSAQLDELAARLARTETYGRELETRLRQAATELEGTRRQAETEAREAAKRLETLKDAEQSLTNQFKVLAEQIFQEKSVRFREESETSLGNLLNPLKERMGEFQQKVEALQQDGMVGRTELREQLGNLRELNQQLSAEAGNLVRALKGSSKVQGDWGEFVLEQMLESAGLRRGEQYAVQSSFTNAEGARSRPDVVLNLPGGRHLVVDAKVSLVDYSAYCDCAEEAGRTASLGRHVASMKAHMRELAQRDYPGLYQLSGIDFVVMFVPVEPAFLLAIARDPGLWQEAWERNVLLVSASTLLFVIRTVAHLWQREQQQKNVQEIVKRGGELYDKLADFAKDLENVGAKLGDAQKAYDSAYNRLSRGKGNAIRQAEMLRQLGARAAKQMPKAMLDATPEELRAELALEPGGGLAASNGTLPFRADAADASEEQSPAP